MTITTTITSFPTAPSRNDPTNFRAEADAWVDHLTNTAVEEINSIVTQINSTQTAINASEAAADLSEENAADSEAVCLATSNFKGQWSSLSGAANIPYSVEHNGRYYMLLSNLANVAAATPGVSASWGPIFSKPLLERSERTSNTILGDSDHMKLIDITSGTFTQTITAVATLRSGWYVYYRNSGTGDIAIDPNSSETIDGLTSIKIYPGEVRLIQCTGTAFYSIVIVPFSKTFSASASFSKPSGYKAFSFAVTSGGGSGAMGSGTNTTATGGGGGGTFIFEALAESFSSSIGVVVGAGGASVTTADTVGNAGGNSGITNFVTVYGGSGGKIGSNTAVTGGQGGSVLDMTGSGRSRGFEPIELGLPSLTLYSGGGGSGCAASSANVQHSVFGGGGGGSRSLANGLAIPGTSKFAGNGGAASASSAPGTAGTAPGGGGGATMGTASGAGADGRVIIRGII